MERYPKAYQAVREPGCDQPDWDVLRPADRSDPVPDPRLPDLHPYCADAAAWRDGISCGTGRHGNAVRVAMAVNLRQNHDTPFIAGITDCPEFTIKWIGNVRFWHEEDLWVVPNIWAGFFIPRTVTCGRIDWIFFCSICSSDSLFKHLLLVVHEVG